MSISRLLFWRILKTTIGSAFVLSFCAWVIQSSRYFSMLNASVPLSVFMRFVSYLSVDIIAVILPIAFAISLAFVYHRFIRSNQLIALQSIGYSTFLLLKPILFLIIFISGYLYVSNMYISPMAWTNFRNLEFKIRNHITLPETSGQLFATDKISIYSQNYLGNALFENLFVIDSRDQNKKNVFCAKQGTVKDKLLILSDGEFIEIDKAKGTKSIARFKSYTYDLSEILRVLRREVQPNEKFLHELLDDVENAKDENVRMASRAMLHQKITSPWLAIIFAMMIFIAVVMAPYSRKFSMKKTVVAFALIIVIQGIYFWLVNSATGNSNFILVNYIFLGLILAIQIALLIRGEFK